MYANILDFGAVGNGVQDDTVAINSAIAYAKTNKKTVLIPEGEFKVSASMDVTGIDIEGVGKESKIAATTAQFDIFKTEGNTRFSNFYIHGGWNGSTTGLSGNSIAVDNTTPGGYPYNVRIEDVTIQWSKKNGIYINRGGYSSIKSVKVNACGLHGCELLGNSGSDAVTTVSIEGFSVFSDCPQGYGIRIRNGVLISMNTVISEYTKGIELDGNDNRSINITNYYQENTSTGRFLTFTGGGVGVNVTGCFGAGHSITYNSNFLGVNIIGNTSVAVTTPVNTYNWNIVQNANNEVTVSSLRTLLGIKGMNASGSSPAHVLDTAPLSGLSNNILELKNNNVTKATINAEGGLTMAAGTWNGGHLVLGTRHIWIDSTGALRTKSSAPTSPTDGNLIVIQ